MTREDAIDIISKEGLKSYNLNEERYNREDELVIKKENDTWIVYATDERASVITGSKKIFINEEEAWDNLIKRLRADKILREV
ncbi:Imm59 family immunity protein [Clostridium sp. LP20]|uniref:Imm59 family immunity protein n=1 Tax=Clostridium sp. LP20 TaxID=3418665 RepID=UPI003EE7B638